MELLDIIKNPFRRMTLTNRHTTYACINFGQAAAPKEKQNQAILLDTGIGEVLEKLCG